MNRVTMDDVLRGKRLGLDKFVEVIDVQGRVIGRYLPVSHPALYVGKGCPLSREEIDRRLQPGRQRYPTEQVIEHLEKL